MVNQLTYFASKGKNLDEFINGDTLDEEKLRDFAEEIFENDTKKIEENLPMLEKSIQARTHTVSGYTECFKVTEFQTMVFCYTADAHDMTNMFTRMSGYFEGLVGTKVNEVATNGTLPLEIYKRLIGGHNIRGDSVINFWRDIEENNHQVNVQESEFQSSILPHIKSIHEKNGSAYLAAGSSKEPLMVFSHELLHGPWEEVKGYKEAVMEYLENVFEVDKDLLSSHIGLIQDGGEEQFANEFQAYVLMSSNYSGNLALLAQRHRIPLAKFLTDRGFSIPVLNPGSCESFKPWPLSCTSKEDKKRCKELNLTF